MLKITVPAMEYWDEQKEMFIQKREQTLQLEHSLVSLSKWESKWNKPFLDRNDKTYEETIDYIKCMTITQNVDPEVYTRLSNENIEVVNEYIGRSMTATTINDRRKGRAGKRIVTSELIYYWMIAFNIPFECQKWHLSRLMTLIQVCEIENSPQKGKRSKADIMAENKALNEARKRQLKTRG